MRGKGETIGSVDCNQKINKGSVDKFFLTIRQKKN